MIDFEVIVFGTNLDSLKRFSDAAPKLPYLTFAEGSGPSVTKERNLDGLLVTLMEAERYGASPPFPENLAIVFDMPPREVSLGLPRYVVAGVHTQLRTPRDWVGELDIFLRAAFRAVVEFNRGGRGRIARLGVLADTLLLSGLEPDETLRLIQRSATDGQ